MTKVKTKPKSKALRKTKLTTEQMATFAARGFLRLDGYVPAALNRQFLKEVAPKAAENTKKRAKAPAPSTQSPQAHYAHLMRHASVPFVKPGTDWQSAYPANSSLGDILRLPKVLGAIESLVGPSAVVDHHFLHITYPPKYHKGNVPRAQHTHQDSTVDTRRSFDIQIMYFPQKVTAEMGGTRFVPGTHLRVVSEAALSRYHNIRGQQHVVCPAGTLLFMHHGMWHGGGSNRSDILRYMFKVRLCPTGKQERLWNTKDLDQESDANTNDQDPIFWTNPIGDRNPVHQILTTPEPWFEFDTSRLEYVNRILFWRQLLGDDSFDADYWLTRIENEHFS